MKVKQFLKFAGLLTLQMPPTISGERNMLQDSNVRGFVSNTTLRELNLSGYMISDEFQAVFATNYIIPRVVFTNERIEEFSTSA